MPQKAEKCEDNERQCANGACVHTSMVCDFSDDCGDNSDENECNQFERMDFDTTSMDGWQGLMDSSNDNHWRVVEASAQTSVAKSPTRDHTSNDVKAKFAIVYNSSNALVSPSIKNSDQCSMRFFVNSCIKGIGHIEVNATTDSGSEIHVTHLLHNQTLYFRRYVIDFSSVVPKDTEFSVKLTAHIVPEAEKLDTACHYFAIDDISFTPKCFQKPQTATSTSSENTSSSQKITAKLGTLIINLIAMCLIINCIIH
ncbi:Apical endosomal glycoprotein-like protein [Leptotrombidium deliense]|uniref:Apical endosomal glycoprotein-like protein n=1 Tax=Leptotrombidium deliense TaxID=299467 RepID=A0A443S721_9ACAR|nr:Apical endosomal glycoprotein-like protein [Leptotrombidium deliense]